MTKKILVNLLAIYLLMHSFSFANSPTMDGRPIIGRIFFDANEITISNSPIVINNHMMAPARAVFEKLGVQIYWIENQQQLLAYRDNIFLKITVGSSTAFLNGKAIDMGIVPLIRSGEVFIPVDFIAKSFDLEYTEDNTLHTINLDFRENLYEYAIFNSQHYKKISTINWGINFFVPEYWEKLEDTNSTYGVNNDYEFFQIEPRVLPLDSSFSRSMLTKALINDLTYTYGNKLSRLETKNTLFNDYLCQVTTYTLNEDTGTTNHFLFVFFENNNGYIFEGISDEKVFLEDAKLIFETIMETFNISKLNVEELAEHYIELGKFYENDIKLDEEIYSNMTVYNQFALSGTLSASSNVRGLHIIVTKGSEKTEYYAPVISGTFKANIFTPFGLGKHNITVLIDDAPTTTKLNPTLAVGLTIDDIVNDAISLESPIDAKRVAMKFSVINASDDEIKFLLPSDYIDYDTAEVYTRANELTYNLSSDYSKTRVIYEWSINTYSLDDTNVVNRLSSTSEMLKTDRGSEVELCILYSGLLRSINIPARIVRGTNETFSHYWVEAFINGKWLLADIGWETKYKDERSTTELKYYNLNLLGHYSQFKKTEFLPF